MVGRLHDHVMLSEAAERAPGAMDRALRFAIRRERGKLVRDDAHLPSVAIVNPQNLGRREALVSGAKRTFFGKGFNWLALPMHCHLIGSLGALGSDHDPFFRHEVLAQLRHRKTSLKLS